MSCSKEDSRLEMVLMDEEDELAFEKAFDDQQEAALSQRVIDPHFETLVAINEASDSFEVNHEGVQKLFKADHPMRVHACIGHYANSSLISKVLEYAVKSLSSSTHSEDDPEEIAQIFSVKSEGVNQKCIVAWVKDVPGELLEGKTVHHVFLDIWGNFETDDPLYAVLAGICTAITTSIVHIQKIELEDSTWTWMHKVALIAKKVVGKGRLEKLIFFVRDWGHPDKFMPGARGGREYLTNIYEKSDKNNDSCSTRIQHLKQLFESTSCYLFPFKSDQTSVSQHWTSSKGFLLYEGSGSEICLPLKEFYGLEDMLRSLEKPQDYLNYLKELQDTKNWIEVTNMSLNSELNGESSPAKVTTSISTNQSMELQQDFHDSPTNFDSTFTDENFFDDENAGFIDFDFEGREFSFESEFAYAIESDTPPLKRFTLQEFLDQSRPDPKQEMAGSEKLQPEQAKNAASSAEEFLMKMIQNDPFEKLSNRINIPSIEIPNFFVQEVSPNSPNTELTCAFADHGLGPAITDIETSSTGTSDYANFAIAELQPDLSSNGKLEAQETVPTTLSQELIDLTLATLDTTDLETLFTASVEMIVAGIIEEADEETSSSVVKSTTEELLQPLVHIILSDINSYTDAMDAAFQRRIFFQTKEDLKTFSRSLIDRAHWIRVEVLNTPACQRFLNNTKCQLEQLYFVINEEIRAKEVGNFEYAMELAIGFYESKMSASVSENDCSTDTLSRAHEKWSSVSKRAFAQAYGGPGEIVRPFMQKFDENLQDSKSRILNEYKKTKELQVVETLQTRICARFESELERCMRNVSISNESAFLTMSRTIRSNAMQKFNPQISSLSTSGQSELKKCLEKTLGKVHENKLTEFQARCRTEPPRNCQNAFMSLKPILAQVGVHFGLEYLSAVLLIESGFRNLYGPHPNVLTYKENEILIGEHPTQSSSPTTSLHLRNVLTDKDTTLDGFRIS